ncbi:hypothetical protein ACIQTW_08275 [Paenarthrobacter sp. NPDC090517]|uniref:hypothetical protein n=1 Tax=Paenarthrobacter sp. NPDC090517 TaxID=3364381 RepID=UPI0038235FE1
MATAMAFHAKKAQQVNEQRIARFAGTVIGLFTLLWTFMLSGEVGEYVRPAGPWLVASHGLNLLSALIVYLYCRRLNHWTSAAGLLCFVAVAFFIADIALGFHYSAFFGISLIAWAASARRAFMAGAGVLACGAAIFARFEPSLAAVVIAVSGVIILATALALRRAPETQVGRS